MGLIRRAELDAAAHDPVVLDLGDLTRRAEQIKRLAREESEQMIADARAERERIIEGAEETGRAEGFAAGREEGLMQGCQQGKAEGLEQQSAELEALQANWTAALDSFAAARDDMLLESKQDVLRLAVLLAEKIVKRKVEIDDRVAVEQLAAVLGSLAHRTKLRVGVNPLDRSQLELALPALVKRFDADHVELYDDTELSRGSVVVSTPTGGQIDAAIESQLERLIKTLLPDGAQRRFGLDAA